MAVYIPNKKMWVRNDPQDVTLLDLVRIAVLSPLHAEARLALSIVGGLASAAVFLMAIPA